ncbi:glutathione S-transferase N-terminal domain-containing protein [Patescibacteria group bacterium]|nr:glutathione S-transferase N-terminal domain-containing protein [Patescibacteria group bacterium]
MLILYYKPTCPFCRLVQATVARLNLEVELRDITTSAEFEQELMARGGKVQVPYLVDEEGGVEMYESDAIVAHLQKEYGPAAGAPVGGARPRVHVGGSVCVSCEG